MKQTFFFADSANSRGNIQRFNKTQRNPYLFLSFSYFKNTKNHKQYKLKEIKFIISVLKQ